MTTYGVCTIGNMNYECHFLSSTQPDPSPDSALHTHPVFAGNQLPVYRASFVQMRGYICISLTCLTIRTVSHLTVHTVSHTGSSRSSASGAGSIVRMHPAHCSVCLTGHFHSAVTPSTQAILCIQASVLLLSRWGLREI